MRLPESQTICLNEQELSERLDRIKQELFGDLVDHSTTDAVAIQLSTAEIIRRVQPLLSNN